MKSIWSALVLNQDHIWMALAGIGAIGTLWVAYKALKTWKVEKKYDLTIDNLALCNVAISFIKLLRSNVNSDAELLKDYKQLLEDSDASDSRTRYAERAMYIYQSRKDSQKTTYDAILKLRERNWAVYGPNHDFYKFYDRIVQLDDKIRVATIQKYFTVKNREDYSADEVKHNVSEFGKVMYANSDFDDICVELSNWLIIMQSHRARK